MGGVRGAVIEAVVRFSFGYHCAHGVPPVPANKVLAQQISGHCKRRPVKKLSRQQTIHDDKYTGLKEMRLASVSKDMSLKRETEVPSAIAICFSLGLALLFALGAGFFSEIPDTEFEIDLLSISKVIAREKDPRFLIGGFLILFITAAGWMLILPRMPSLRVKFASIRLTALRYRLLPHGRSPPGRA